MGRLGTEIEAPLSGRKRISNLDGVEKSFLDFEIYRLKKQLEGVITLVFVG